MSMAKASTAPSSRSVAKRRRVSSSEQGGTSIIRSPHLWFEGGTIVLQAENTQFRVHKGHLTAHSARLRTMFRPPQSQGDTQVEGCPLVCLPDRAKEWSDLLKAMYNVFVLYQNPDEYPIHRLLSILRLVHRYEMNFFREITASQLKRRIPRTFSDWDFRSCLSIITITITFTRGYEFDFVNTALEVGLQTVLPFAYLLCICQQSFDSILDGVQHKDGRHSELSHETKKMLISAKDKLIKTSMEFTELNPLTDLKNAYRNGTVVCERPTFCADRHVSANRRILRLLSEPGVLLDLRNNHQGMGMCTTCSEFLDPLMEHGRKLVWDALPLAFGLPPYSELRDR